MEQRRGTVFGRLDAVVAAPDALLASKTSSIPIMKLARVTSLPESVVGIHFFNPVLDPLELIGDRARRLAGQVEDRGAGPAEREWLVTHAKRSPRVRGGAVGRCGAFARAGR